jgi:hypothetical protein
MAMQQKGGGSHLPVRPFGCFAQMTPDPFFVGTEILPMSLDSEIVVVSGLPRSGTSLVMQMLHAGGIEVVTDQIRAADVDNPRGYFEFEAAKRIEKDASWLPAMRGKAFKMVSQLLYHLPPTERYRVLFMQRDLDEVLLSQEKMLRRRSATAVPREQMKKSFLLHLEKLMDWLHDRQNMSILAVNYNGLLDDPRTSAEKVGEFLDDILDVEAMVQTVDPSLYRNRAARAEAQG